MSSILITKPGVTPPVTPGQPGTTPLPPISIIGNNPVVIVTVPLPGDAVIPALDHGHAPVVHGPHCKRFEPGTPCGFGSGFTFVVNFPLMGGVKIPGFPPLNFPPRPIAEALATIAAAAQKVSKVLLRTASIIRAVERTLVLIAQLLPPFPVTLVIKMGPLTLFSGTICIGGDFDAVGSALELSTGLVSAAFAADSSLASFDFDTDYLSSSQTSQSNSTNSSISSFNSYANNATGLNATAAFAIQTSLQQLLDAGLDPNSVTDSSLQQAALGAAATAGSVADSLDSIARAALVSSLSLFVGAGPYSSSAAFKQSLAANQASISDMVAYSLAAGNFTTAPVPPKTAPKATVDVTGPLGSKEFVVPLGKSAPAAATAPPSSGSAPQVAYSSPPAPAK